MKAMYQVVIALLLLTVSSNSSQASSLPDFPFVTVEESASRNVRPDEALVSFEIVAFAQRAEPANATMVATMNAVVALTEQLGIAPEAITAYEVDKRAKRQRDDDYNELDILGYEFSRSVSIKLSDLDRYVQLMEKLLTMDHVEGIGTEFSSAKRSEVEAELIAEAANKAREKAAIMAKGLNVELGSVFAFNDSGSFSSFFATFGLSNGYGSMAGISVTGSRGNSIFIPKFIEIQKTINVIYKLQ